jgi:hypothetical protein
MLKIVSLRFNQYLRRNSTSLPFLSGDGFNLFSQETSLPVFFIKSERLENSLLNLSDQTEDFVLIAGNSDRDFLINMPEMPRNLRRLYLQNSFISDGDLIRTLPIGVENLRHSTNGLPRTLRAGIGFSEKRNQILLGPFGATHSERAQILDLGTHKDLVVSTQRVSPNEYSKYASTFRLVACPRGNGVDTHRVWETLYRGSIPIVIDNAWSRSLEYLNLPIIRIPAWTKNHLLETLEKSAEFIPKLPQNLEFLWINAWEKLFRQDLAQP